MGVCCRKHFVGCHGVWPVLQPGYTRTGASQAGCGPGRSRRLPTHGRLRLPTPPARQLAKLSVQCSSGLEHYKVLAALKTLKVCKGT